MRGVDAGFHQPGFDAVIAGDDGAEVVAAGDAGFAGGAVEVSFDGADGQGHFLGDLFVGESLGGEGDDFALAGGQG